MASSPLQIAAEALHEHSPLTADITLIEQLQYGCPQCFSLVFYKYCNGVFRIAWGVLRDRGEAEDVVQEVFLDIYKRNNRYDAERGSVKTWILQSAYFKALSSRRRLKMGILDSLDESTFLQQVLNSKTKRKDELRDESQSVREGLTMLNERQRRTIELIHFDGYTLLETASILKESLPNTRNLYYRGLKALRTLVNARGNPAAESSLDTGESLLDVNTAYPF